MHFLELPEFVLTLAEFLPFEDAADLGVASVSMLQSLERANTILLSRVAGMELYGWRACKCGLYQQLNECKQPQVLVDVDCCRCNARWGAYQMALSLDTSVTCFIRYWIDTSNAENGCPCVGLIAESFAIFCDPYTGNMRLCDNSDQDSGNSVVIDKQTLPKPNCLTLPAQNCLAAEVVGWESWAEATTDAEGRRLGFAILISNGSVEFIRQEENAWERSGIVLDKLPGKLRCCAGLMGFVGQAFISIEEVRVNESLDCLDKWAKNMVVGKVSPWTALSPPVVESA